MVIEYISNYYMVIVYYKKLSFRKNIRIEHPNKSLSCNN